MEKIGEKPDMPNILSYEQMLSVGEILIITDLIYQQVTIGIPIKHR